MSKKPAAALVLYLVACGSSTVPDARLAPPADATARDATVPDASSPDAGSPADAAPPCAFAPPCPAPSGAGSISVCGRVLDVETSQPVANGGAVPPLEARACEPLAFAVDGACVIPISVQPLDACGYYAFVGIENQPSNFVVVATDDLPGADEFVQTAIFSPTSSGATIEGLNGFATRRATVASWDASSGGPGFEAGGAYLAIFLDPAAPLAPLGGTPAASVQIVEGSTVDPSRDFYFSDTGPLTRTMIAPAQAATGTNGSAIMINTGLGNHSGTGGEPMGCTWPLVLGAAVPNVIVVHGFHAECM